MKPILTLNKIKENVINYKFIEVIAFNYDGKGAALCLCYNKINSKEMMSFIGNDLHDILWEENYKTVQNKKLR